MVGNKKMKLSANVSKIFIEIILYVRVISEVIWREICEWWRLLDIYI